MSNDFLNVAVESDFAYQGGIAGARAGGAETMEQLTEALKEELLMYQMSFQQGDWLDSEIQHICDELIQTGQMFAKNQGFGEGLSIGTRNSGRKYIKRTGALLGGFRANPITAKGGGRAIDFRNVAQNERGEYYAGHLEYGFHDRGGNFIPARPFMRPAMYAVAEGSKGNFNNILKGMLQQLWTGKGFHGVSDLTFGRKAAHRNTNFWGKKSFSGQLSKKSTLKDLRGDKHRKWMSTMRKSTPRKKAGYKLTANRKEFQRLRNRGLFSYSPKSSSKSSSKKETIKPPTLGQKTNSYSKTINGVHYKDFNSFVTSYQQKHEGAGRREAARAWRMH